VQKWLNSSVQHKLKEAIALHRKHLPCLLNAASFWKNHELLTQQTKDGQDVSSLRPLFAGLSPDDLALLLYPQFRLANDAKGVDGGIRLAEKPPVDDWEPTQPANPVPSDDKSRIWRWTWSVEEERLKLAFWPRGVVAGATNADIELNILDTLFLGLCHQGRNPDKLDQWEFFVQQKSLVDSGDHMQRQIDLRNEICHQKSILNSKDRNRREIVTSIADTRTIFEELAVDDAADDPYRLYLDAVGLTACFARVSSGVVGCELIASS
jgi:hypothetical protein